MSAGERNQKSSPQDNRNSYSNSDNNHLVFPHPEKENSTEINQKNGISVTPWEVTGDIDYAKLIDKFGTSVINERLIQKLTDFTGDNHNFLKTRFFFSHRDLDVILKQYESGNKFYLYTGRGPSGPVHLGHLMPWIFTRYLQEKFDSKLLFQITDDEKFLFNENSDLQMISKYTYDNILDIISVGFDSKKTRIIINTKDIKYLYKIATEIAKRITFSTAKAVFGFTNSTNIGMIGFPPIQGAPCFLPSLIEGKPTSVLIPAAIDQDPYWRMTRDIAEKLGYPKPAQIHSKFIPSLMSGGKMSSSKPDTALFTTDESEILERKIKNMFTGGQPTVSLQRKLGANARICPVYWYLKYLFDDEEKSNLRYEDCTTGNLLCGECKNDLIKGVIPFMKDIRRKREEARNRIDEFMIDGKYNSYEKIEFN